MAHEAIFHTLKAARVAGETDTVRGECAFCGFMLLARTAVAAAEAAEAHYHFRHRDPRPERTDG